MRNRFKFVLTIAITAFISVGLIEGYVLADNHFKSTGQNNGIGGYIRFEDQNESVETAEADNIKLTQPEKMNRYPSVQEAFEEPNGNYGRFVIVHDEEVYSAKLEASANAQETVDDTEKAWIETERWPYIMLCDHAYHGFDILSDVFIGDSMWIRHGEDTERYMCIYKTKGHRHDKFISDANDIDIESKAQEYGATHVAYTCSTSSGQDVYITMWKPYEDTEME